MDQSINSLFAVELAAFAARVDKTRRDKVHSCGRDGLIWTAVPSQSVLMSRRPARFTQADLARAIRAIAQAEAQMMVEISPDGTLRILPAPPPPEAACQASEPERTVIL